MKSAVTALFYNINSINTVIKLLHKGNSSMINFSTFYEGVGFGGLEYEAKVRRTVASALRKINAGRDLTLKPDTAGGFANNVVDMYMNLKGKDIAFEIKMDKNAQMGGPSVKINKGGEKYSFSAAGEALEKDVKDLIIEAISTKEKNIRKWISEMKKLDPKDLHAKAGDFEVPFQTTKEAWAELQGRGLLKTINTKVIYNTKYIHDWYAKKGCYYMQIGKAGLFYLKENPLNLPIPQLNAQIEIVIRLTRSGSGGTKAYPTQRNSQIRCIANLKAKGTSSYSLDNEKQCIEIFNHMLGK